MRVILFVFIYLLCACDRPLDPMLHEHVTDSIDLARSRGDLIPLETKAETLIKILKEKHLTDEGLLAYRALWDRKNEPLQALNSDTLAWTSLWSVTCSYWYRSTNDVEALKELEKSLRALDHLARVSGVPGLLARTFVKTDKKPATSDRIRQWKRGVGNHNGIDYSKYYWRTDNAKAQLVAWLLAVHLGIETAHDNELLKDLREDLGHVTRRIFKANLNLQEADARWTRYGDLHPSFRPPVSWCLFPCLFVPFDIWGIPRPAVAPNALVSVALARTHDAHFPGDLFYRKLANQHFDEVIKSGLYQVPGIMKYGNDHLSMLAALAVAETHPPKKLRDNLQQGMTSVWERHRFDRNVMFTLIALKVHALKRREQEERLKEALFSLKIYPLDRRIYQVNQTRIRPLKTKLFAADESSTALPLNFLASSSFLWKSPPNRLKGYPGEMGEYTHSPLDFLFAYWLLRDLSRNNALLKSMIRGRP